MTRRLAVTGGCGGIGRALLGAAQDEGMRVAALDLPATLERHPPAGAIRALPCDATDPAQLAAAFGALEAEWGGLDAFVHLTGFAPGGATLEAASEAVWRETLDGNLTSALLGAQAALPLLRRGEGPAMAFVSSGLGLFPRPGYGCYSAAKAGLIMLTKQLALECAPGIRVNCVAPSAVDTGFLRGGAGRSDETAPPRLDMTAYAQAVPLERIAEADDVVGPLLFLLSDAARYVTGQTLHVNGGLYMP